MRDKVIAALLGFLAGLACVTVSGCTVEPALEPRTQEECALEVYAQCYCKGPDVGDVLCTEREIRSKVAACMAGYGEVCWGDFRVQEEDMTTSWYCEDAERACA